MNFNDDSRGPCDCAACSGPADLHFGAGLMETIHVAGPMPIGAIGLLAMSSGADPFAVAGVMSLIQTAGLIEIQDDNGNVVLDPASPRASVVALTESGTAEVKRCAALGKVYEQREQDGPRPRFDPNNN